jgi:hypothetical protein
MVGIQSGCLNVNLRVGGRVGFGCLGIGLRVGARKIKFDRLLKLSNDTYYNA